MHTPRLREVATALLTAFGSLAHPAAAQTTTGSPATPGGPNEYVPRIVKHDQRILDQGRGIRQEITVLREVTRDRDEKIVIVKSVVDNRSKNNGTPWNGAFGVKDEGYWILVPETYHVDTYVSASEPDTRIILQDQAPRTDGSTDRQINEKITTKVSSGVSMPLDIANALEQTGVFPFGKAPITLTSGKELTEEYSVTMTLKDYSVESFPRLGEGKQSASWKFNLARDIANNTKYFFSRHNAISTLMGTSKMTPMMRRATLETTSSWRLPGNYEGFLDVTTQSHIVNRIHSMHENSNTTELDGGADIALTTRIDLSSPYLKRQPVVRLQSLSGTGACLTQPDRMHSDVSLATCLGGDAETAQQWYLEIDNSYRNVGSGMCLTTDIASGRVHAEPCSAPLLNQQWQWRADRLHSLYTDGGSWRLHVLDGALSAKFDAMRHQTIPSNQYHPLMRPWSSYPAAPSPGDVIPNLTGISPPIPMSFLSFGRVPPEERWQPVPVHTGI